MWQGGKMEAKQKARNSENSHLPQKLQKSIENISQWVAWERLFF
jgi:hypothetical protein